MKKELKIDKNEFISWYFDDTTTYSIVNEITEGLIKSKDFKYTISLNEIWNGLGYIPLRLVKNKKAINKKDIADNEEIEEPSCNYTAKFE